MLQVMLQGYVGKYGVGYGHSYAVILICILVLVVLQSGADVAKQHRFYFPASALQNLWGTCFSTAALAVDFSKSKLLLEDVSSKHFSDRCVCTIWQGIEI